MRHVTRVFDLTTEELNHVIDRALRLKADFKKGETRRSLIGKILGLLFEKHSTRTRVSFEAGMQKLGGSSIYLSRRDLQLDRGEPLKDTARVLSRYVDAICVRTYGQEVVEELARWASIPVINGLSDKHHPCQGMSDVMTVIEKKGDITRLKVAWVGDGNNVAHSWIEMAARLGFHLVLACPEGYDPDLQIIEEARQVAQKPIEVVRDPKEAVKDAQVINTDVWASMGQEEEAEKRKEIFAPYQVNEELLKYAAPEAIVLHCLPAHRGEEIAEEVLEGPQSVVWDQAENKMWLHMALLEWLLAG
ncbi:ornithine carbamoyltransferase [Thermodesulfatator indicus DSM 15286]|uniref:Ornithine carbamoyltransferase n=1 Tax=Thermodesulfatator indicus (strain DSM 15286 / JCM 11887 / CIR29812) TaxID=667014 RepID=F8AE07_THEID|nr:ornithine carbamoyltransferase [Thermodesulfatator indicus]AEH44976.1 ornithine carbamoyltransferase [Thermodesulfatator indicus DSM 15286]